MRVIVMFNVTIIIIIIIITIFFNINQLVDCRLYTCSL